MSSKLRAALRQMKANPIDTSRDAHINMVINVVKSGVKKSFAQHKEKGRDGLPIPTEINWEREEKLENDRNYEITNIKERRLRSGKHKGEKVEVVVLNNPPGVRYKLRSWK